MSDLPRLLAATPGRLRYVKGPSGRWVMAPDGRQDDDYTRESWQAMRGEPGGEPEALSESELEKITTHVRDGEDAVKAAAVVTHAARAERLLADLEAWRKDLRADHLFTHNARRDYADARRGITRLLAMFDAAST